MAMPVRLREAANSQCYRPRARPVSVRTVIARLQNGYGSHMRRESRAATLWAGGSPRCTGQLPLVALQFLVDTAPVRPGFTATDGTAVQARDRLHLAGRGREPDLVCGAQLRLADRRGPAHNAKPRGHFLHHATGCSGENPPRIRGVEQLPADDDV